MDEAVVPGRHVLFRHRLLDVFQLLKLRSGIGGVRVPAGKVEAPAAFGDVMVHEPGNGSEARGPRPAGLVRMAVITGTPQGALDRGGSPDVTGDRWIGVLEADHLRSGEKAGEADKDLASHPRAYFAVIVPSAAP